MTTYTGDFPPFNPEKHDAFWNDPQYADRKQQADDLIVMARIHGREIKADEAHTQLQVARAMLMTAKFALMETNFHNVPMVLWAVATYLMDHPNEIDWGY